jgi:hypothetical protein
MVRKYIPRSRAVFKRTRHNYTWGRSGPVPPAQLTEFECVVIELGLAPEQYMDSPALRLWASANRNRRYIPEELLNHWGLHVDLTWLQNTKFEPRLPVYAD